MNFHSVVIQSYTHCRLASKLYVMDFLNIFHEEDPSSQRKKKLCAIFLEEFKKNLNH